MFLNIREEDIRADCPHNAPMTLRAFNKISPREFNTSVSPLNPFEIPRYAPKTVGQFSKALVQQQSGVVNQLTNALSIAAVEEAILAETDPEDFIMDVGFDAPTVEEIDLLAGEEEEKGAEEGEPRLRRTKAQMTESRTMGAEDTRTLQRDQDRMRERVARGAAREGAKEREPPVGLTPPLMKASTGLRGAAEYLDEIRDPNVDLSDEMRLRALEMEKGIDYGGGAAAYGE